MKHNETRRVYSLIGVLGVTALAFLMLVSLAGAAPYAYITNYGDSTVSVIDTATDTVTATVPVGSNPCGVAVSPDGKKVYVANAGDNTTSIIDTSTNTVKATVNVGNHPLGIAVTPDGKNVYVTNQGSSNVSVIDTATNTVTAGVDVDDHSLGVAVTPDGNKIYVTQPVYYYGGGSNNVDVIDTSTNIVTATMNVSMLPYGVAVSPDGSKVYVTSSYSYTDYVTGISKTSGNVSVIDTATNKVIAKVKLKNQPQGVAVTPDGTKVYVSGTHSGSSPGTIVYVIDATTNTVTATVNVGYAPYGVSVTPDGKKVYVANVGSDNISVIDTATNTVTATVNVGDSPRAFGQFISSVSDNESPVINSVILSNSTPETGDSIVVTVDVNDNIGISSVVASGISLLNTDGNLWRGNITTVEGTHSVNVSATDTAGNIAWDNSTSYTATTAESEGNTYAISLSEGWNLISIPLLPEDTTISSVLSPISGSYSIVWAYDKTGGGVWKMYDPGAPIFVNDLKEIKPGKGYWIMMTANDTLPVNGTLQDNSLQLESGWNLIGYNSLSISPIDTALASLSGNYSIVWTYDTVGGGVWKMYDPSAPIFVNDLKDIGPGRGYWIMIN